MSLSRHRRERLRFALQVTEHGLQAMRAALDAEDPRNALAGAEGLLTRARDEVRRAYREADRATGRSASEAPIAVMPREVRVARRRA